MMLRLASRRLPAGVGSVRRGSAAAAVAEDVLPDYVLSAPVPTVTKLDNGVTVASCYGGESGLSHVTARISSLGARHDVKGGESALLASLLGGEAGREHVAFSSLASLSISPERAEGAKAGLAARVAGLSYESQTMDQLHATAFQGAPAGNSLANLLSGTPESVASLTAEDAASVAAKVHGGDVAVVGTGAGHHDKLVEEVAKVYGSLPSAGGEKAVVEKGDESAFVGSDVRIRYDSHDTATVALAFSGASWTDPKALPLALMTSLLGSYDKSAGLGRCVVPNMCQEVAEHDLARSISSFSLNYSDAGLFGVLLTAPDNKLDDLLWFVMPNLVRLAHGFSDEELLRAKAHLKARILSSIDGDVAAGIETARQIQTIGRVASVAETMARVDALDQKDVTAAASEVVDDQDHALAAIGGVHELPDYQWIRRHSYMLRY